MARGNQRELAREKALKKSQPKGQRTDGVPAGLRKEHDAAALKAKIEAKKAASEPGASGGESSSGNNKGKK